MDPNTSANSSRHPIPVDAAYYTRLPAPIQPATSTTPTLPTTPTSPTTPTWPPLSALDPLSLRLHLYKLRTHSAAAHTDATDALTRFELAYGAFTEAAAALRDGDVRGYRAALRTAREAADGVHAPQRRYDDAVRMMGAFVAKLGGEVGAADAGWGGRNEEAEVDVDVDMFLGRVKMRLRGLEEEERRLCGVADRCLGSRGGDGHG